MNLAAENGTIGGYFFPFGAPFEQISPLPFVKRGKIKKPINNNISIHRTARHGLSNSSSVPSFSMRFFADSHEYFKHNWRYTIHV
jgi:hypothetical protein